LVGSISQQIKNGWRKDVWTLRATNFVDHPKKVWDQQRSHVEPVDVAGNVSDEGFIWFPYPRPQPVVGIDRDHDPIIF